MNRNGGLTCECNSTGCVCAKNNGATNTNNTNARDLENDTINSFKTFLSVKPDWADVTSAIVWLTLRDPLLGVQLLVKCASVSPLTREYVAQREGKLKVVSRV